jgi:excisionase family DNA binding protein
MSRTLTTQQAADLLGITRVTFVKLLEEKKIPFERIGTHRRVKLSDVLTFRETRKAEQYAALEVLSAEVDDDTPVEEVLEELQAARKAIAAQRRASR